MGAEAVKSLGVEEFVELLASPPPGVDELVALADVIAYAKDDSYDRVIVDTAPTGHALRLLDLPQFADGFVERLVRLRDRVGSLATLAGGALGVGQVAEDVDAVASKLEGLRDSLELVRSALRDSTRTEFLAVGIRATQGCFNCTSTGVVGDRTCQKKHTPYENLRRDDHPSKNEPKRVETGRDMSLES